MHPASTPRGAEFRRLRSLLHGLCGLWYYYPARGITRYSVMNEFTRFLAETGHVADRQSAYYVGWVQQAFVLLSHRD